MIRNHKTGIIQTVSVLLLIVLDQLTKLWALNSLEPIGEYPIIDGVFHLDFVENTGAAFSMLEGKTLFLIIVPLVACAAITYVLLAKKVKPKRVKTYLSTWSNRA